MIIMQEATNVFGIQLGMFLGFDPLHIVSFQILHFVYVVMVVLDTIYYLKHLPSRNML